MATINEVRRILGGSTQFQLRDGILTVTGYYTGNSFKLDLNNLTEEILEELAPEADDEDDEE
jgi:hypothetical protein